jgi:hypothetical protein
MKMEPYSCKIRGLIISKSSSEMLRNLPTGISNFKIFLGEKLRTPLKERMGCLAPGKEGKSKGSEREGRGEGT